MADTVAVVESDSPPVVVISDDGDEVTVVVSADGPRGPAGPTSADQHYVFNQGVASALWTIIHNLGKYPSVLVQDSANSEIEGDIEYVSVNELKIKFSAAFSGTAYLN